MTDLLTASERAIVEAVRERIAAMEPGYRERAEHGDGHNLMLAPPRLLAIIDRIAPGGDAVRVLSRQEALAQCARAGLDALDLPAPVWEVSDADVSDAGRVLSGARGYSRTFADAIIAEARRLVASGQCPALADCEALRAPGTDKPAVANGERDG